MPHTIDAYAFSFQRNLTSENSYTRRTMAAIPAIVPIHIPTIVPNCSSRCAARSAQIIGIVARMSNATSQLPYVGSGIGFSIGGIRCTEGGGQWPYFCAV